MALYDYGPVTVPMPKSVVTDGQVNERVNSIVSQIPVFEDIEGAVERDDKVTVRITMRENGVAMKGLENADLTLTVGDGFFPEGLVDGLVGMKAGEAKHIEWQAAAIGAQNEDDLTSSMDADVELLTLNKRVKPAMTDEWVKAHIPRCDSLDDFFSSVRADLEKAAEEERANLKRERVQLMLAQRIKEPPSVEEIDRSIQGAREEFSKAAAMKGQTDAQLAAEMGMDEERLEAVFEQQGAMIAAVGKAIKEAADHFDIEVSDDEINEVVKKNLGDDPSVISNYQQGDAREQVKQMARYEKMLDRYVNEAIEIDEEVLNSSREAAMEGNESPYPNPFA